MFYLSYFVLFLLAFPPQEPTTISGAEAKAHAGQIVRVCGIVKSIKERRGNAPTFLNFDQPYPKNEFTAIIWRWQRHRFLDLGKQLGRNVCVTGQVREYRGRAQMTLTKADQLSQSH